MWTGLLYLLWNVASVDYNHEYVQLISSRIITLLYSNILLATFSVRSFYILNFTKLNDLRANIPSLYDLHTKNIMLLYVGESGVK